MSESDTILDAARARGSLGYLAAELEISQKQAARYWDNGWIDGTFRTAKGHRRIRYTDDTIESVRRKVRVAKQTNINIRYHLGGIETRGRVVCTRHCNTMEDLYREAQKPKYGLTRKEAAQLAFRPRSVAAVDPEIAGWEMLRLQTGVSQHEVDEQMEILTSLPLVSLLGARDAEEFRLRARRAWRQVLTEHKAEQRHRSSTRLIIDAKANTHLMKLRKLLLEPNRESFLNAYHVASEVDHRIMCSEETLARDPEETLHPLEIAQRDPRGALLYNAVLRLKHTQQRPRRQLSPGNSASAVHLCIGGSAH
jgi:hypothetical protein